MKKRLLPLLAALLLLTSCARDAAPASDPGGAVHVLATTYPVYLLTTALTQDAEGIEVELLVNAQTSCLHDYTLTVRDMKAIESADVIVMNGVGLEDFMADALAHSHADVIDCSQGIELLSAPEHEGHDGHDHGEEYDPHIWMDPTRAGQMMGNIALGLDACLDRGDTFHNAYCVAGEKLQYAFQSWPETLAGADPAPLITFHDGFRYFADAFGLELLKAIEEEEGATASAAEIKEVSSLVEAHAIPAVFTEANGSDATARAIARETGAEVYPLDMLMSGDGVGIQPYIDAMNANLTTILEALG